MEEKDIIDMISEAEAQALAIVTDAQAEAAAIVTEAEKRAMEISKATEGIATKHTEEILTNAKAEAEAAYQKTLSACKQDAAQYADAILEHVEPQVMEIVGRISK